MIQLLYATLLFAGYSSYTATAFPYVSESIFGQAPFYLLIVNLVLFAAGSCVNPGVITKDNYSAFVKEYEYDQLMYVPADCSTCLRKKPARSKHCCKCQIGCLIAFIVLVNGQIV